jgi:uncharacterized damage-inducible protein DinB
VKPTSRIQTSSGGEFIEASRTILADDYVPKLVRCWDLLSEGDIWWRPNPASNAIGNMVLHMCGNLREWIIGGAGGERFDRDRPVEFSTTAGQTRDALLAEVVETAHRVDRVLADLPADTLLDPLTIQGFEVTRLHAVYHAIEHFGYHLGQIAYVVKLRTGKDLEIF